MVSFLRRLPGSLAHGSGTALRLLGRSRGQLAYLGGAALIAYGVYQVYAPAGLIAGGVLLGLLNWSD